MLASVDDGKTIIRAGRQRQEGQKLEIYIQINQHGRLGNILRIHRKEGARNSRNENNINNKMSNHSPKMPITTLVQNTANTPVNCIEPE